MKESKKFEIEYLNAQTGEAEIGRIRFLLIFFGFLTVVIYALHFAFNDFFVTKLGNEFKHAEVRLVFLQITAYYLVAFFAMSIFRNRRNKSLSWVARIVNAIIEGCIPSLATYSVAHPTDLAFSLAGPHSLAYAIFIILSAVRLDFRLCLITAGTSAISFYFVTSLLVHQNIHHYFESLLFQSTIIIIKSAFIFLIGICAAYVALQVKQKVFNAFQHIREREEVKTLLGAHVSPQIADELINNKEVDVGEERDLSIMFLDIRNFTKFSETKEPRDVFLFLNELFTPIIEIINARGGVINKFLGDGFMAIFGAPIHNEDHAAKAVKSAIKIREYVKEQSQRTSTHTRIGIGIHSGKAMTGNIGSNLRKEYTIIGDVVNLASRIEQLNKELKSEVLVSKETMDACKDLSLQPASLGDFDIKGRQEKVTIFKLA